MSDEHRRLKADVFLVGGAVRDTLLGRPIKDRDWLVVGATPQDMADAGFYRVGEFPVFIDPSTNEEYALARTERKVGTGYHGFETCSDPTVTLREDLARRDLTMNAMALRDGEIVDPFGGRRDMERGILRHVSEAFAEDPLRVLRTARFAATYGFGIASETLVLCRNLAASGELATLTPERVALEFRKALKGTMPSRFFHALDAFNALESLFPEVYWLKGQTQPVAYHAEGDAFLHVMKVLDTSTSSDDERVRFGALVHDFGKAVTPKHLLPHHHGHEEAGMPIVEHFVERLKLSNELRQVGVLSAKHHHHIHNVFEMTPKALVSVFNDFDRQTVADRSRVVSEVARADHYGRTCVVASRDYPQMGYFQDVMVAIDKARLRDAASPEEIAGMSVDKRKQVLHRMRLDAVKETRRAYDGKAATEDAENVEDDAPSMAFGR